MHEVRGLPIRNLRPGWLLLLAAVVFCAVAVLGWWNARKTIRETRQLGGWTAVSPQLNAVEPFAVDAMVEQIGFEGKSVTEDHITDIIHNLTGLSTISLSRCRISDSALRRLGEIATLTELILKETDSSDATAAVLSELKPLRHLSLDRCRLTDAALPHLARLPNLTYLGLSHTPIGDAGLAALRGHPSLRSLDLSHTNVTDEGLEHLRGLNLAILRIDGSHCTPEGLDRFRRDFRGTIIGAEYSAPRNE